MQPQEYKTVRNLVGDVFCFFKKLNPNLKDYRMDSKVLSLFSLSPSPLSPSPLFFLTHTLLSLNFFAFPKLSELLCKSTNKRSIV